MKTLILTLTLMAYVVLMAAQTCPKPLFTDPTYNGSCDPEIVWNEHEQEWWMFYTGRRPAVQNGIYSGCALGVATSKDWINWDFKGYCKVDGIGGMADSPDTYWAPGIIKVDSIYHMFVTFKKGNPGLWGGSPTILYHLTAPANDLLNGWKTQGGLNTFPDGIDAGMFLKQDTFYMYHRDIDHETKGSGRTTKYMTSTNLKKWDYKGWAKGDINNKVVNGSHYHEAQYVFYWKNKYWLLTDPTGKNITVFESDDCINWTFNGHILDIPGEEETDAYHGRHPSVAVIDGRAFIFYHVEPYTVSRKENKKKKIFKAKDYYAYLQIAELELIDGKLVCDRNKAVTPPAMPKPNGEYWGQSDR